MAASRSILAFTSTLLLLACRVAAQAAPTGDMPKALLDSAYRIVASRIGEPLARHSLIPAPQFTDFETTNRPCASTGGTCRVRWARVAFTFHPSSDTSIVGLVIVPLDTLGRLFPGLAVYGAPECVPDPHRCVFVDADSAQKVARAYGLPSGLRPWRVKFGWAEFNATVWNCPRCSAFFVPGNVPAYVWDIEAVTKVGPVHEAGPLLTGRYLLIDASTGAVIGSDSFQREE